MTSGFFRTSLLLASLSVAALARPQTSFRPPAVPLIAHDPYFSIWATTDQLYGGPTRHWTSAEQPLNSLIRIDSQTYRLMGSAAAEFPPLPQTSVEVHPTNTEYRFANQAVEVVLTFTTPTLPDDIEVLARPASYISWSVRSQDGHPHDVQVYFDASGLLTVNRPDQRIAWAKQRVGTLDALKIGSEEQPILAKAGDNLRIDWGHLYLAAPGAKTALATSESSIAWFIQKGRVTESQDRAMPRPAGDRPIAASISIPMGKVGKSFVSRHAILAYDDLYSIQYFGKNLRPFWRRNRANANDLLRWAERDYTRLFKRCADFDRKLELDLTRAGGEDYRKLGSLAFRQSFAAQKVVADRNGQPLMFSKENFSNGCIGTVDVLYPAAPALLLFSPNLLKASMAPILEYAASPRWKWPFAPHDLGTYPKANGQVYGGGERTEDNQMPVEESGNMLILLAALAKIEGNTKFSDKYWPQLTKWANYLADKGFDPESQLSTDDFAGHLAHNVNLSAKAIEALGAYAYLCRMKGITDKSTKVRAQAEQFAARWVREAAEGDHFRLAFDRPGTWSQKYNLVWDRLLRFNLFPSSVLRTEMDYYLRTQNPYGLPLDNRRDYTKLDWIVWTATLTGRRSDFEALAAPTVRFLNDTPDRVPMTDWFHTVQPKKAGFQARSVVGGVFIKLLENQAVWRKYALLDRSTVGPYLSIPKPPIVTEVVPTARSRDVTWQFTTTRPGGNWLSPEFKDSTWLSGPSGFGTAGTPGAVIRTLWNTPDIWLRRDFELPKMDTSKLALLIHHDEDAEVYLNGVLTLRLTGYTSMYEVVRLSREAQNLLHPGKNTLAVHCRQTTGGQYIDVGFATVKEQP